MEKEKLLKIIEDELFKKLAKLPANDLRLGTAQKMMDLISDIETSILIADTEEKIIVKPCIKSAYSTGWKEEENGLIRIDNERN